MVDVRFRDARTGDGAGFSRRHDRRRHDRSGTGALGASVRCWSRPIDRRRRRTSWSGWSEPNCGPASSLTPAEPSGRSGVTGADPGRYSEGASFGTSLYAGCREAGRIDEGADHGHGAAGRSRAHCLRQRRKRPPGHTTPRSASLILDGTLGYPRGPGPTALRVSADLARSGSQVLGRPCRTATVSPGPPGPPGPPGRLGREERVRDRSSGAPVPLVNPIP